MNRNQEKYQSDIQEVLLPQRLHQEKDQILQETAKYHSKISLKMIIAINLLRLLLLLRPIHCQNPRIKRPKSNKSNLFKVTQMPPRLRKQKSNNPTSICSHLQFPHRQPTQTSPPPTTVVLTVTVTPALMRCQRWIALVTQSSTCKT